MQRDPNITRLDRVDPDAGREVLLKLLQHSTKCENCVVVEMVRRLAAESARRRGHGEGD